MNTVPGSENASINDPARRNLRPEDAQDPEAAAQRDAAREEPPSTRQSPPREEPPDTRDSPPRREPAGEEKRIAGASKPAIPLGSDDAPDRSAKADLKDKASAQGEQLAPLFAPSVASEYRARWVVVQQGFVDDPWRALQQGDELLSEVMGNLRDTFEKERSALEGRDSDSDRSSTELLRVALRRHRAFFERLLSF